MAKARIGAEILLAEIYRGKPHYAAAVFVRADSKIRDLGGLRGRDIAFADPISESGYLYPLDIFVDKGLLDFCVLWPDGPHDYFHPVPGLPGRLQGGGIGGDRHVAIVGGAGGRRRYQDPRVHRDHAVLVDE